MAEEKTNGEEIYGGADGALGRAEKSSKARREFIEKAMEPVEKAKQELIKDTATDESRLHGTKETGAPKGLRPYVVEKVNVVDRKALGALIEKAKAEGRRWKVSKCVREGYRYTFTSSAAIPLNEKSGEPKLDVVGTPADELPPEPETSDAAAPTAEAEPERVLTAMDVVRSLVDISVTDDGRLSICAKPEGEPKDGEEQACITTRPVTDEERAALGILPGDGVDALSDEASSAEKVDEGIRDFFRKRKEKKAAEKADDLFRHSKYVAQEEISFELTDAERAGLIGDVRAGRIALISGAKGNPFTDENAHRASAEELDAVEAPLEYVDNDRGINFGWIYAGKKKADRFEIVPLTDSFANPTPAVKSLMDKADSLRRDMISKRGDVKPPLDFNRKMGAFPADGDMSEPVDKSRVDGEEVGFEMSSDERKALVADHADELLAVREVPDGPTADWPLLTDDEFAALDKPGSKWEYYMDWRGSKPVAGKLRIGGKTYFMWGDSPALRGLQAKENALRVERFGKKAESLDEASSAEKRAYRNGGEDAEDLIYGRTIGRLKNRLARNTLADMYKNGGEDREAAKDALKEPAEKVASDFEGKETKMQAKGYREEDDFDMDDIKSPIEPKPSRKCPKCGKADLNDAGECPLCDLGDESVLDDETESLISEGAKKPLGGDRFVDTVNSPIDSVDYLAELDKRGVRARAADGGVMVSAEDYDFALDILMELEDAEYSHEGDGHNESCFGGECKSDKPLNEDSPVPSDVEVRLDDLDSFRPVAGARETWDAIAKAGKTKELAGVLADFAKDGKMTTTDLNDMLWFERDWVLSRLGINGIKPDDEIIDAEAEEI